MYEYFEWRRFNTLEDTIKDASDKGFRMAVYDLLNVYSDIYHNIIKLKNHKMLGFLLQRVTCSLKEAYEYASGKGIHHSNVILGRLDSKVEEIKKQQLIEPYSEFLAMTFCALGFNSIKKPVFNPMIEFLHYSPFLLN